PTAPVPASPPPLPPVCPLAPLPPPHDVAAPRTSDAVKSMKTRSVRRPEGRDPPMAKDRTGDVGDMKAPLGKAGGAIVTATVELSRARRGRDHAGPSARGARTSRRR